MISPTTILLIGSNSFIGKSLSSLSGVTSARHNDSRLADLISSHDIIINCAFHPALRNHAYDAALDFDSRLAALIQDTDKKFVMLSSRTVYGNVTTPMRENMPLQPVNLYSANKARIEDSCRARLGDKLLILRMSNIFGFEWPPQPGRVSFMSQVLSSLKDRHMMTFDIAARSEKDFLPVAEAARLIHQLCRKGVTGTLNLGAGQSLAMLDITAALKTGFGAGEAEFQSDRVDSFYMDTTKLRETGASLPQLPDILREFEGLGRKLAGTEGATSS